jgi:segregation and condensation protein A
LRQLEIDNDVINHLLFHKSLIDEKDNSSKINFYVDLLKKANEGEHISIENEFDRSIALAFELVMQQHLNPWDIDLVKFSTIYLNRAKEEKIDLITAGRIIYMAWKVLKLQSDDLVLNVESKEDRYEPLEWGDIPTEMWLSKEDSYSYTNLVMNMTEPPIDEPLRRKSNRKVTLIELIDAFEKAKKESEEYQLIEMQRREQRELLNEKARKRMKGTAVEDHLEKDVDNIWNKIKNFSKKTILLTDLCEKKGKDELIKIFISVLFLAMDDKVLVYQKKFPFGKIYIKNKEFR